MGSKTEKRIEDWKQVVDVITCKEGSAENMCVDLYAEAVTQQVGWLAKMIARSYMMAPDELKESYTAEDTKIIANFYKMVLNKTAADMLTQLFKEFDENGTTVEAREIMSKMVLNDTKEETE